MVLTRWSNNNGTIVTPVDANIWTGSAQIPVTTGEFDFNVYQLIDADLGAICALRPQTTLLGVAWQVLVALVVNNASSISAFGGNPPRRKLGNITYAQGIYAVDYEPINYSLSLLKRQIFIFGEGLPEPSLQPLSTPSIPVGRGYIAAPFGAIGTTFSSASQYLGATRAQLSFNAGILGIAEIAYTAIDNSGTLINSASSILVSQL